MSADNKRLVRCVVSSDKMDKTRVGKIVSRVQHPVFKKFIQSTTKVVFHDENNTAKLGDEVYVYQTKPASARKRFAFHSVITEAK
jgi:small subunit ribosomal protein S17